ncbi:metal/formaldehyde-sensitive transcriptional repressor [Roseomonas sp. E05]|uniref:metal/formaldehyde-sensitive transcriptional repressor n=1 Tax=Roseomonas sp. E05 TaxID=3046310 RepID=UPI0024B9AF18|nr:metal/formaldehyde-sensitive transcriptional repressor [Roseomonas sp. E05]MDJ0390633.1 metal/formaldehyde-sensitive transcriptional repressor [Roseomonas sp. E05]
MSHLKANRQQLLNRVRRIAGQVEAVERALLEDAECAVTLQRVAAVRGAVNGLLDEILEDHLREHVARPGLSDEERREGAEDMIAVIRRYAK